MTPYTETPAPTRQQKLLETARDSEEVKEDESFQKSARKKVARRIFSLWEGQDDRQEQLHLELRANYLRYAGIAYIQRDPKDPNKLYIPPNPDGFAARSFNLIERGVDRYRSQVLADDPVMQAVPKSLEDEDVEAAEAASEALVSEFTRLKLVDAAGDAFTDACIFRSMFAHFFWDPRARGQKPAQKFFTDEDTGRKILDYVDKDGNRIPDEDPTGEGTPKAKRAASVWEGEIDLEFLTPFQVRYSDGVKWIHDADEVWIRRLIPLRKAFAMYPELKDVELNELFPGEMPGEAEEELVDLSGESGKTAEEVEVGSKFGEGIRTGKDLDTTDRLLDQKVSFMIYYHARSPEYPQGYWCHVFGKDLMPKKGSGTLKRWGGRIPVSQMKCLYHPITKLGRSLVDILRHKQDVIDWIEGHILRYLRSMKDRWLIHMATNVSRRQLKSRHDDVVYYEGPQAPQRMPAPQLPSGLGEMANRYKTSFDDDLGIHDPLKGKHVPGVQSGRHVEALQAADQTVLSLSKDTLKIFFEESSKIILAGVKGFWKQERQIAFHGRDRIYVQRSFSAVDFGDTEDVRLAAGSLLMITPAQRAEIMTAIVEGGLLEPMEIRKFLPTNEVAGFELAENPHFQRAKRENEIFLAGPPPKLNRFMKENRRRQEDLMEQVQEAMELAQVYEAAGIEENDPQFAEIQRAVERAGTQIQQLDAQLEEELAKYLPEILDYETSTEISAIHWEEHSLVLSRSKVDRIRKLYPWWFNAFVQHTRAHGEAAGVPGIAPPPQQPGQEGGAQAPPPGQAPAPAPAGAPV